MDETSRKIPVPAVEPQEQQYTTSEIASEIVKEVDETIKKVCRRIQTPEILFEDYSDTVKALALLVEARARLLN